MLPDTRAIQIFVPGPLNERALGRLKESFTLLHIEDTTNLSIPRDVARKIRGIASIVPTPSSLMDLFPNLEIVAHFGVGYDSIDVKHAASRGIMVTNTPGVNAEDAADIALGLLLNAVRELPRAEIWLREGKWISHGTYPLTKLTLRGRRAGIYGLGRVGLAIARRLEACGLSVAYHNRKPVEGVPYRYYPTLVELAEAVDTLISAAPFTENTVRSIDANVFKALGQDGVFVNIGRGGTVDEDALILALQSRTIAAAGLDVFANEPRVSQTLLDLPSVTLAPHIGSATEYTRRAMADLCVDNLISWFAKGRPISAIPELAHIKSH